MTRLLGAQGQTVEPIGEAADLTAFASWQVASPLNGDSGTFDFVADQNDEDPTGSIGLLDVMAVLPACLEPGLYAVKFRVTPGNDPTEDGDWQRVELSIQLLTESGPIGVGVPQGEVQAAALYPLPAPMVVVEVIVSVGAEPVVIGPQVILDGVVGGDPIDPETAELNMRLDIRRLTA